MKKLLFLLISLFAWGVATYAQESFKGMEIALHKDLVKNNSTDPEDGPQTRGIITQEVYAYLYNKEVTITFEVKIPAISVKIIKEHTGEVIFSYMLINQASVSIDLSTQNSDCYVIEISSKDFCLNGNFNL